MDDILRDLIEGRLSLEQAREEMEKRLYGDQEHNIDVAREHRTGIPEVVISEGKSLSQVKAISLEFLKRSDRLLISRIGKEDAEEIIGEIGGEFKGLKSEYNEDARFLSVWKEGYERPSTGGRVGILTAGTSDIPVAMEAEMVAREMGCEVRAFHDIGVAGVHRVWAPLRELKEWDADVMIVAAGREGALPTLVSGMIDIPVIGLPISTGYGLHGKGETALFAMLQSCSPLTVVNIDAGFVAGAVAARIANHRKER
ncbi:MAG: nickel pincer cofactor biosynthesis protein LarB [Thermoplasmatota archaeon]